MNGRPTNPTARPAQTGAHRNGAQTHCLLWLPRGYDAPIELVRGLDRRHVRVRQVHDAPAIMVALARPVEHTPAARVLVIVEPAALRQPQRLVDAVRRHYPKTLIWQYELSGQSTLTRWSDEAAATDLPASTTPAPTPTSTSMNHEMSEPKTPRSLIDEPEDLTGPLLTDEELAMLLGESDEQEAGRDG